MSSQVPMIDVSSNNHLSGETIQWSKVHASGYRSVMIKATEGVNYINPWLGRDADQARQAGLGVGYYHFAHPGVNTAIAEADHALNAIHGLPRTLGLALDLEVMEGLGWVELAAWARAFHAHARTVVDHSPLYVNDNYLANLPGAPFGERLWLAQTARPRRQVWAWQMTVAAKVPGIAVPCDVGFLHPDDSPAA